MNSNVYPTSDGSCRAGHQLKTTNWLCGMMVGVLRQYFGSEDRMTLEKSTLRWSPDITASEVQIDMVDNVKFDEGAKFPKLLVDMENQTFLKDVLGDLDNYDGQTGQRNYNVRSSSAFTIEAWCLSKIEAWSAIDEVRFFLTTFRHEIAKQHCLDYLRPVQANKPVKSKLYDDYWIGRLIVEFNFEERWGVLSEQLAVSDFVLKLGAS